MENKCMVGAKAGVDVSGKGIRLIGFGNSTCSGVSEVELMRDLDV